MQTKANLEGVTEDLAKTLAAVELDIVRTFGDTIYKNLGEATEPAAWKMDKLRELESLKQAIGKQWLKASGDADLTIARALESGFRNGGAEALEAIGGGDALGRAHMLHRLAPLLKSMQSVTNSAGLRVFRDVEDTYRSVLEEVMPSMALGVVAKQGAMQAALDKFAEKGVTAFVDKNGREWGLKPYVEMATRTAYVQSQVAGHIDTLVANDTHLVMVSDHGGSCKLCSKWEGKVLQIAPLDKYDNEELEEAGVTVDDTLDAATSGGLFHPRCRHRVVAFFPGITKPNPHIGRQTAEEPAANVPQDVSKELRERGLPASPRTTPAGAKARKREAANDVQKARRRKAVAKTPLAKAKAKSLEDAALARAEKAKFESDVAMDFYFKDLTGGVPKPPPYHEDMAEWLSKQSDRDLMMYAMGKRAGAIPAAAHKEGYELAQETLWAGGRLGPKSGQSAAEWFAEASEAEKIAYKAGYQAQQAGSHLGEPPSVYLKELSEAQEAARLKAEFLANRKTSVDDLKFSEADWDKARARSTDEYKGLCDTFDRGGKPPKEQLRAYEEYMGDSFTHINRLLRGQDSSSWEALDYVDGMKELMKERAVVTDSDMVFFRGVKNADFLDAYQAGDIIEDSAFTSVSTSIKKAREFAGIQTNTLPEDIESGSWVMQIFAPRGMTGIPGRYGEGEFILDRGSRMRIVHMDLEKKQIFMEALPDEAAAEAVRAAQRAAAEAAEKAAHEAYMAKQAAEHAAKKAEHEAYMAKQAAEHAAKKAAADEAVEAAKLKAAEQAAEAKRVADEVAAAAEKAKHDLPKVVEEKAKKVAAEAATTAKKTAKKAAPRSIATQDKLVKASKKAEADYNEAAIAFQESRTIVSSREYILEHASEANKPYEAELLAIARRDLSEAATNLGVKKREMLDAQAKAMDLSVDEIIERHAFNEARAARVAGKDPYDLPETDKKKPTLLRHDPEWDAMINKAEGIRHKAFNKQQERLLADRKYYDAWVDYTGEGYVEINNHYRGIAAMGEFSPASRLKKQLETMVDKCGDVLEEDIVVFRGVSDDSSKMFVTGNVREESAFLSTTSEYDTADEFRRTEEGWLHEIRIPKGTRYLTGMNGEFEIILDRGTKMKITEIDPLTNHMRMEVTNEEASEVDISQSPQARKLAKLKEDFEAITARMKELQEEIRVIGNKDRAARNKLEVELKKVQTKRKKLVDQLKAAKTPDYA